jgi:hypothetical protein
VGKVLAAVLVVGWVLVEGLLPVGWVPSGGQVPAEGWVPIEAETRTVALFDDDNCALRKSIDSRTRHA